MPNSFSGSSERPLYEIKANLFKALAHPARMGARINKQVANIARDIALNELLQTYFDETKSTLGAEFPPEGCYGPQFAKYAGWNWERIYSDIMDQIAQQPQPKGGQGDGDGTGKKSKGNGLPKQFDNVEPSANEDGTPQTAEEAEALARAEVETYREHRAKVDSEKVEK